MHMMLRGIWRAAGATGRGSRAIVHECRDVLRDNGTPSWSRWGSAVIVATWCYVAISTRAVPERTEMVGVLLAALYGSNQLPKMALAIAQARAAVKGIPPPAGEPGPGA